MLDPEIAQQRLHNQSELIIGENNKPSDCFCMSDAFCRHALAHLITPPTFCTQRI